MSSRETPNDLAPTEAERWFSAKVEAVRIVKTSPVPSPPQVELAVGRLVSLHDICTGRADLLFTISAIVFSYWLRISGTKCAQ